MELKEKYRKRFEELIKKFNLDQASIEQIKKNYYLPVVNLLFKDEIIFKRKNFLVYKRGELIGFKINEFLIKLITGTIVDLDKKTLIIPLSIDEGEELFLTLIDNNSSIYDFIDTVFAKIGEKEKKIIYKHLDDIDNEIQYYILKNYPPLTKINGILDDIIMKVLEKMTNTEIVTLMLMMDISDRKKILRNVSQGRKKIIIDELSYIHYFKKSERYKVRNKFIKLLKELLNVKEYL